MKKNEVIKVKIVDISNDGQGIGKTDGGFVVFVNHALTGEVVNVLILKVLKNKAFGKIVDFVEKSPCRIEPVCPVYSRCGGCSFMHSSYENELKIKTDLVKNAFKNAAGIDLTVNDTIGSEKIYGYRNKTLMPVSRDDKGKIIAGFYKPRSHTIVKCENCLILPDAFQKITNCIIDFMTSYNIEPYKETDHSGIIRHIFIRKAEYTNEIMVGLVTKTKTLKNAVQLIENLVKLDLNSFKIVSIIQNVNPNKTNVILGERVNILWGKAYITDRLNGFDFNISALSFYQVNPKQAEVIYNIASKMLSGNDNVVFDLYSGIGTIAICVSNAAKKVYGIESVADAVSDAVSNAKINNIKNVEFLSGLSEAKAPELIEKGISPSAVILDPPRGGCEKSLIDSIIDIKVNKVIYISCNPATLARDVKTLSENGYNIEKVQPVDMFPRTYHVETVVLLKRNA